MKWLTGSPTVSINLNADIVAKCTDKNSDLLIVVFSWLDEILSRE